MEASEGHRRPTREAVSEFHLRGARLDEVKLSMIESSDGPEREYDDHPIWSSLCGSRLTFCNLGAILNKHLPSALQARVLEITRCDEPAVLRVTIARGPFALQPSKDCCTTFSRCSREDALRLIGLWMTEVGASTFVEWRPVLKSGDDLMSVYTDGGAPSLASRKAMSQPALRPFVPLSV